MDNFKITILSFEEDYDDEMTIRIFNDFGYETQTFNVLIQETIIPETWLSKIMSWVIGLFPDSEDLSTAQRIGFVLISMLLITVVLLLIAHTQTGGIPSTMLYITGFLNFILMVFFISIGYISIGVVVVLSLILIALTWFKFSNGNGGE